MTRVPESFPACAGPHHGWPWTELPSGPALPDDCAWPKITIVTPSYNQGDFLEKTIRSVLLQGYPNLEYIIIDGGSTDGSVETIKRYEPWLAFWVSETDRGQSHALNKGLARGTGELLGWLNSDDFFLPGALFSLAKAYLQDRSVGAVYGQGHLVDEQEEIMYIPSLAQVSEQNLFAWFSGGAEFMQPSCLFTHLAWKQCGPLSEDLHFAMDLDLWINIAKNFEFKKIDDLISVALKHARAKTTSDAELSRVDVAIVYAKHGRAGQARAELEKLLDKLNACRAELEFIYRLPLVWRLIGFFKKRQRFSVREGRELPEENAR